MKWGGATKQALGSVYIIPSTYTEENFGKISQENEDFTWRFSDCEELVGGLLTGDDVSDLVVRNSEWRCKFFY